MESAAQSAAPVPPGRVLAAERERQGLSRAEIAQRLHMSPSQVEALETGEYGRLPKGPFLRGFVRNYAKALGLEPEALLAQLAHESPAESAPRIVVPSQNIRFDPLGERLSSPYVKAAGIAAVAIALGFAAMYWWLFIRPTPPAAHKAPDMPPASSPAPNGVPPPPAPGAAASMPQPTPGANAATVAAPSGAGPVMAVPPKPEATPPKGEPGQQEPAKADATAVPVPGKGEGLLQFRFKGESWVEVRDARDNVVFQRLNPPDSEAAVTGKLPLRVIVGNASDVSLRFNGREFSLEPHTKVAVARFTLE